MSAKKTLQYISQYKWSNVFAMIRNNYKDSKICTDEFKNKLVVITGTTSGIGLVTAHKYASMGANLLCVNRNIEKSKKLKHDIETAYKVECNFIIADSNFTKQVNKAVSFNVIKNLAFDIIFNEKEKDMVTKKLEQLFLQNPTLKRPNRIVERKKISARRSLNFQLRMKKHIF